MKKLLVLLLSVLYTSANATEWYFWNERSDAARVYFVDRTSMERTGRTVTLWFQTHDKNGISQGDYTTTQIKFFCGERRYEFIGFILYKSGQSAGTRTTNERSQSIPPGTVVEGQYNDACKPDFLTSKRWQNNKLTDSPMDEAKALFEFADTQRQPPTSK